LQLQVLHLDAPVNPETVAKFWRDEFRVMVASTLAAGEGLNLQCCSDCIMMERQWNPPKEEQAESRFIRIGQLANKITATYFIAVATVDEFFADLVEQKRSIFGSTIDGIESKWNESDLLKELAEILAQKGGKKWGI
jgi:SNF2 family DNA or RNA helicase